MLEAISKQEWDRYAAAHLLRRAGFGAAPKEVEAALARGPHTVVADLVDFPEIEEALPPPAWISAEAKQRPDRRLLRSLSDEERRKRQEAFRAQQAEWLFDLRGWWLNRMRFTKFPLKEKLTLFWHGHFTSSAEKVHSTYCLYRQNELYRTHGIGNWRTLLVEMAKDPAMLIYLDNAQSKKDHPNENFARELMELFTLGEGHYTEQDVKEAARAFTGWTLHPDEFEFIARSRQHDDGTKRVLSQTGKLGGEEVIDAIIRQPQSAVFIARKLWSFFAFEDPPPDLTRALARALVDARFEFRPFLKTVFLSREFYSDRAMGTQIKSPVQWLVGTARATESPLPDTADAVTILRALGQELFAPPSVKGWDGGIAWISTTRLLHRYNIAGMLVKGAEEMRAGASGGRMPGLNAMAPKIDPSQWLSRAHGASLREVQDRLQWRLYGSRLREKDVNSLTEFLSALPPPEKWTEAQLRDIVHLMMSTPQYQLC